MTERGKAVLILVAVICFLGAAASEKKTLKRSEDPVVIEGGVLSSLVGKPISSLALMSFGSKGFKPIPFQVDERTDDGKFVFTHGPRAHPEDGDGILSLQDELVFMAWDSGDKASGAKMPEGAESGLEIMLTDPVGGSRAWVYLFSFSGAPPRSDIDYVKHSSNEDRNWVETDRYLFAEKKGETYFDRLMLRGKQGRMSDNLADRIKGRGNLKAVGGRIKLQIGESDTKGDLVAWLDGPIRVVHLMQAYIKISIARFKAGGGANNLFYQNYFVTPIFFNFPIAPSTMLSDFKMIYGIDLNKNSEGMSYFDAANPKAVIMDGKMDESERNLDRDTVHDWWAITGDKGNLMVRMILPGEWKDVVLLKTGYIDDDTSLDPPESVPGQRQPGFLLDGMYNITKGDHIFYRYYYVPGETLTMANVKPYLDMLDNPLKVDAHAYAP